MQDLNIDYDSISNAACYQMAGEARLEAEYHHGAGFYGLADECVASSKFWLNQVKR